MSIGFSCFVAFALLSHSHIAHRHRFPTYLPHLLSCMFLYTKNLDTF